MEVKIINERENPLMKRREILAAINYQGGSTPSKAELQKILADQLKANIENIEITKILSEVGISKGKAWIKVWQDKKVPIYSEIKKEKQPEEPKPKEPKEEIKPEKPEVIEEKTAEELTEKKEEIPKSETETGTKEIKKEVKTEEKPETPKEEEKKE